MKPLKVALLGCGTVGSAVLRLVEEQSGDLAARIGRPVRIVGVAVRRQTLADVFALDAVLAGVPAPAPSQPVPSQPASERTVGARS